MDGHWDCASGMEWHGGREGGSDVLILIENPSLIFQIRVVVMSLVNSKQ